MKETEIVKIGYERLSFNTLYLLYIKYYINYAVSDLEKEKLRKEIKEDFEYYYLKDSLIHEHINRHEILYAKEAKQGPYKIVAIPQKELEVILLKNKLGGYINSDKIVTEQEFDKLFDEFYPKMIELISEVSGAKWDCI